MNRTTTTRRLAWTAAVALAGAVAGLVAVNASANPAPARSAASCQAADGSTCAPSTAPSSQPPAPKAAAVRPAAGSTCAPPGPLNTSMLPSWPPAGTTDKGTFPGAGTITCTYAVGYSGVPKLGEALVLNDPRGNPKLESVAVTVQTRIAQGAKGSYVELDSAGQFDLPPSTSTFVTFGFVPTRATVSLIAGPAGVATIADSTSGTTAPTRTVIHYRQTVRLSDVLVNGVLLDVGDACEATGADTVLQGVGGAAGDPRSYDIERGGLLTGRISIPAFTGCGSGGHLDSLISAEVSGTELLELEQAPLCLQASGCSGEPVPALPSLSLMPTS